MSDDPAAATRVIVVESAGDSDSALWAAVETRRRARVAWLSEVRPEETVEIPGGAFLDALDEQTAPFTPIVEDVQCRAPEEAPLELERVEASLFERVDDPRRLDALLPGVWKGCVLRLPVVVVAFDAPDRGARTEAIRARGPGRRALTTAFPVLTTFLTFGPGRARWDGVPELWARSLIVEYDVATARSDYVLARDRALAAHSGSVNLIEAVLPAGEVFRAATASSGEGFAEDIGLALSGTDAAEAWLTRAAARVGSGEPRQIFFDAPEREGPELSPTLVDSSGCAPPPLPLPPREAPPKPWDEPVYGEPASPDSVHVVVDTSCSGEAHPSESCSGDPGSDDDSCSGSSSSSESDSCSGDSSSSSDDDSCSGSSSSSDDDSCSGSSSSSDDQDEACVNASAAVSPKGGAGRRRRARLSVWTLALAGLWLPIRRLRRGGAPRPPDRESEAQRERGE